MNMTIKPKVSKLSDLQLIKFLKSNVSRYEFLEYNGFEVGEQQTLISLSFYLKDRIKDFISLESMVVIEESVPHILMIHQIAFPDSAASNRLEKMTEWLEANDSKLFLVSALYFLKHFEGEITEKTVFAY